MNEDEKRRLEAHARELEEANARLKALDNTRAQILSNVSHELRTPLVTIIGYVEMLAQGELGEMSDEGRKSLQVVLRNALRLSTLIDDLLDLSRLQADEVRPFVEALELPQLVQWALDDQRLQFAQKEVEVSSRVPPDLPLVEADRRLTRIVLGNLLKNALKFTGAGGRVWVEARVEGDRVRVSVHDTGIGIPPEERDRVFEPFFQVDGSPTRSHGGIGAGLAIVKRIVEAHGGTVTLESEVGRGTAVSFDLARAPADAPGG